MSYPVTPHLKFPINFVNGVAEVVEQDTEEEILQCIEVILTFPRGSRDEHPEFGLEDQTFKDQGADIEEIMRAIALWEPRADILIEGNLDALDVLLDRVSIRLRGSTSG